MSYLSSFKNSLSLQLPEDQISPERRYASLRDNFRHLSPAMLNNWRTGAAAYGLLMITTLLTFPQPMITRYLIDVVILKEQLQLLVPVLLLLVGIAVVSAATGLFQTYYATRFNQKMTLQIQQNLIRRVLSLPKTFFDHIHKGYLMSRLTSDVNGVSWFFSGTLLEVVIQFFRFIGGLCFLFYLEWHLAIMVILSLPVPFLATVFFAKRNYVISHHNRERNAHYYAVCCEMFATIPLIKTFCREKKAEDQIVAEIRNNNRAVNDQAVLNSVHHHVMAAMPGIARFLVLAWGSYWVITGEWTIGSLLAFIAYLSFVYSPVNYLATGANQMQSSRAALARVAALLNAIPEDNTDGGLTVTSLKGEVEFKLVNFAYDPQQPVLTGVSFYATPGQHWAVIGKSGAGKTTLASLILQFYRPSSGGIFFDGVKASDYNIRCLRSRIGFVAQHTELLSGSILDNLKLGNDDASFAEVEKACKVADIDRYIKSLPQQYSTRIGEAGVNLSEGQKQRLSIARSLVKSPDILIMDEPTSALDNGTELSIYAMLPEAVKGKTLFTIAHRLNTVKFADQVLFLRQGEPPLQGTHEELMKQNQYKTFFGEFETAINVNHSTNNEA